MTSFVDWSDNLGLGIEAIDDRHSVDTGELD
jgi:hypothetical protein